MAGDLQRKQLVEAADRIAASPTFAKARRATQLLRYLVEARLAGREEEVKEYTIADAVFERSGYDSRVDSTVRVEASRLRSLLVRYYESEGASETLRIEIPKGGYTIQVQQLTQAPDPPPARRRWFWYWAGAAGFLLLAGTMSFLAWRPSIAPAAPAGPAIAVLPFDDLSSGAAGQSLADGLTEEITNTLVAADGLEVVSRKSAMAYKGRNLDVRRIGRELGVHAVLEGAVRLEAGSARVTLRLTNARNGFHLWTRDFEQPVGDPLALQRKIAADTKADLLLDLDSTWRALTMPPTMNEEAWRQYLRGVRIADGAGMFLEAAEHFEAAVRADPGYAPAWASLANFVARAYDWGYIEQARMQRAEEAATRAISLSPTMADGHIALGRVKALKHHDWAAAESALERALRVEPLNVDARHQMARLLLIPRGRFAEAVDQLKKASTLDSTRYDVLSDLGCTYVRMARWAEADQALSVDALSGSPAAFVCRGISLVLRGRFPEAQAWFEKAAAMNPTRWSAGHLGYFYAVSGQAGPARRILAELAHQPGSDYEQAVILAALGDQTTAMAAFHKAYEAGTSHLLWAAVDYRTERLRALPAFQAVLRKLNLA